MDIPVEVCNVKYYGMVIKTPENALDNISTDTDKVIFCHYLGTPSQQSLTKKSVSEKHEETGVF